MTDNITSYNRVKKELESFLLRATQKEKFPEVLLLRGAWGCGKSHVVDAVFNRSFGDVASGKIAGICKHIPFYKKGKNVNNFRYLYVSLFGKNSIEEIKYSLYLDCTSDSFIGSVAGDGAEEISNKLEHGKGAIASLSKIGLAYVGKKLLEGSIVCIDDIERKGDALRIKDVMGFISELKDKLKCSVILIMHDEKLSEEDEKILLEYKEKTVDMTLRLAPSAEDAVKLFISKVINVQYHDILARRCAELKITNLRCVQKIMRCVNLMDEHIKNVRPDGIDSILSSLVFLMWVHDLHAGNKENIPSLAYIKYRAAAIIDWDFLESKRVEDDEKKEIKRKWDAILSEYSFFWNEVQDAPLLHLVEHGFLDKDGLIAAIAVMQDVLKRASLYQKYSEAWELYHANFQPNEDEVLTAIYDSTLKAIHLLKAGEVHSAVNLLRVCGKNDQANEIVNAFVAARKDDHEFLKHEAEWRQFEDYRDIDFKAVIDQMQNDRIQRDEDSWTIEGIVDKFIAQAGWNNEYEPYLAERTVEEYKRYLLSIIDGLHEKGRALLFWKKISNPNEKQQEITRKVEQALREIGNISPLQNERLGKFSLRQDQKVEISASEPVS